MLSAVLFYFQSFCRLVRRSCIYAAQAEKVRLVVSLVEPANRLSQKASFPQDPFINFAG